MRRAAKCRRPHVIVGSSSRRRGAAASWLPRRTLARPETPIGPVTYGLHSTERARRIINTDAEVVSSSPTRCVPRAHSSRSPRRQRQRSRCVRRCARNSCSGWYASNEATAGKTPGAVKTPASRCGDCRARGPQGPAQERSAISSTLAIAGVGPSARALPREFIGSRTYWCIATSPVPPWATAFVDGIRREAPVTASHLLSLISRASRAAAAAPVAAAPPAEPARGSSLCEGRTAAPAAKAPAGRGPRRSGSRKRRDRRTRLHDVRIPSCSAGSAFGAKPPIPVDHGLAGQQVSC